MTEAFAFNGLRTAVTFAENTINATPQQIAAGVSFGEVFGGGVDFSQLYFELEPTTAEWARLTIGGLQEGDVLRILDPVGADPDVGSLGGWQSTSLAGDGFVGSTTTTRFTDTPLGPIPGAVTFTWTEIEYPGIGFGTTFLNQTTVQDLVNGVLSKLHLYSTSDTPPATRTLTFSYTDFFNVTGSATMVVTITPENDAPIVTETSKTGRIAPFTYQVPEGKSFAADFQFVDPEGNAFTTTLEGEDASLFTWRPGRGSLVLNAPRDRETQSSADGDDVYEVTLVVFDTLGARRDTPITITVLDQGEAMGLSGFGPLAVIPEGAANAGLVTPVRLDTDLRFTPGDMPRQIIVSGLLPEDRIGLDNPGAFLALDGLGGLYLQDRLVGSVAGGQGKPLVITLLPGDTTTGVVETILESLVYSNASDVPTPTRTLTLDVVDIHGQHANRPIEPSFLRATGAADPFRGFDAGDGAAPVLTPLISADGVMDALPDLVVGRSDGLLRVSENLGGGRFAAPTLYVSVTGALLGAAVDTGAYSAPAAVDLDGDGRTELVIGTAAGTLRVFGFDATFRGYEELTGKDNPFASANVSQSTVQRISSIDFVRPEVRVDGNAAPAFVDLDRDGLLDLVVGGANGRLAAWKNMGSDFQYTYDVGSGLNVDTLRVEAGGYRYLPFAVNPFAGIDAGNDAAPAFADLEFDGLPDLVLGNAAGDLVAYRNTGNGFVAYATDPFGGASFGEAARPTFGDVNDDGLADLVVGLADGTFATFLNEATVGASATLTIAPENDAPTITSPAAVTYVETRTGPAYRIEARDLDGPGALTFSISGLDVGLFNINSSTGEISFKGAPNFETPIDTNVDNVYVLTVTAKDALNAATSKAITITVTDVPEVPALTGLRPFLAATEGGAPVLMDGDVTFKQGQPLSGAVLTVSGLVAGDVVGLQNNALINYNAAASLLNYNGQLISGVIAGGNGNTFSVTFIDNASEAAVDAVIQALTFASTGDSPTATRTLTINLTQAGGLSFAPAGAARHWEEVTGDANPLPSFNYPGLNFTPQVANLINDSRPDLLIGTGQGDLLAFTGQVDPTQPSGTRYDGASGAFFQGIALPPGATDVAAARGDVNGDDIVDMVVGSSAGLQVFLGQADGSFALAPPSVVSPLIASDYAGAVPVLRNIDGDSAREIIVSPGGPGAYRFDALDFSGGAFVQKSTVYYAVDAGSLPTSFTDSADPGAAFLDVTGDGVPDIIAGTEAGTLRTWQGTPGGGAFGTANTLAFFSELTGSANPFAGIDVGSRARPTLSDVDGDGFTDLIVGAADGGLHWIRSTAALPQITVQVAPTNDAPVAPFGTTVFLPGFQTDAAGIITKAQLLQGWSDPEGDFLQVYSVVASRGTLQDLGDGTWRYLSPLHATGTVTLSYVVSDGALLTDGAASFGLGTLFAGQVKNGTAGADPLAGTVGNDTLRGKGGADSLEGGLGNDRLNGGGKADSLSGGNGADTLGGGSGDDSLAGGDGMDRLDGSDGNDRLTGGADADIFTVGAGADVVTDFEAGLDRLKVTGFLKYKDVQAAMADTADGVLLTMTGGTVLLDGLAIADLSKGDFILA